MTLTDNLVIAPSLLSADPLNLAEDLKSIEPLDIDWHHVDVMDGHFVPNLTYGPPLVAALKKFTEIPLDVHIMVTNPDEVALQYVKAGASVLSFHVETANDIGGLIDKIQGEGCTPSLAVNPDTPIESVFNYLDKIKHVLIMSVYPGFGGQKYISSSTEKIAKLAQKVKDLGIEKDFIIEVDGGINSETAVLAKNAGANALVAGSYIYKAEDRKAAIDSLRKN